MLPEYRRKTNIGIGIGLVLQVAAFFWLQTRGTTAVFGLVLILISVPMFIWGCVNYAEGKGHSKWVGLVGLAGIIGMMVLIILPDQNCDGSFHRLQTHRLVGLISTVLGLGLVVLGRWLVDIEYASAFIEEPWPYALIFLGAFIVVISLMLLTHDKNTNIQRMESDALRRSPANR